MKMATAFAAAVITVFFWGISVFAAEEKEKPRLGFKAEGSSLFIYLVGVEEECLYELSINGGRDYISIGEKGMYFSHLSDGTYQLCVRKKDDPQMISDITAACISANARFKDSAPDIICEGLRETDYLSGGIRVTLPDYTPGTEYIISCDGGRTWRRAAGRVTEITGLAGGYYTVCAKTPDGRLASDRVRVYVPSKALCGGAFIRAPMIKQLPELPTGCEITSLAMYLHFYGFTIDKTVLSDCFLEKSEYRKGDYRKKFVGDPKDINAYGCYAGVIERCAKKFLSGVSGRSFTVDNITGCEPERLYAFLDMGYPVIVWATGGMGAVTEGPEWIDEETGNTVKWIGNEHCLLLTGYDLESGCIIANDPLKGVTSYPIKLFEKRYDELFRQAIVIIENK